MVASDTDLQAASPSRRIIFFDSSWTLYDPPTGALFDHVEETLTELKRRGYELIVVSRSGATPYILQKQGVWSLFTHIVVNDQKAEVFRSFLGEAVDPITSFCVGDRAWVDIAAGNAAGLHTIWIPSERYAHQSPRDPLETPQHTIRRFRELLDLIPE